MKIQCKLCELEKKENSFYFYSNKKYKRQPCKKCISEITKKERKNNPWKFLYWHIKSKCKKGYGKNIKCLFKSEEEIKYLWNRDKAWLLRIPSIDRIDNNKNYYVGNCHFIEKGANSWKARNIDYPTIYIKKLCSNCGKQYQVKPSRETTSKYCSVPCKLNHCNTRPTK